MSNCICGQYKQRVIKVSFHLSEISKPTMLVCANCGRTPPETCIEIDGEKIPITADKEALNRIRQWFHKLQANNPDQLERKDYRVVSCIYHALEERTPKSIREKL